MYKIAKAPTTYVPSAILLRKTNLQGNYLGQQLAQLPVRCTQHRYQSVILFEKVATRKLRYNQHPSTERSTECARREKHLVSTPAFLRLSARSHLAQGGQYALSLGRGHGYRNTRLVQRGCQRARHDRSGQGLAPNIITTAALWLSTRPFVVQRRLRYCSETTPDRTGKATPFSLSPERSTSVSFLTNHPTLQSNT